jgi:hypothetical protein
MLLACGLNNSCTTFSAPSEEIPELEGQGTVGAAHKVELLLAYYDRIAKLSNAEVAKEQLSAQQLFNRTKTDYSRVRLALVLSAPNNAARDGQRALALLEPLLRVGIGDATPMRNFALVLRHLIAGDLRTGERLQSTIEKLKEDLRDQQKQAQILQQKLDTLKALEKSTPKRNQ